MKWKGLTADQIDALARDIEERAHDEAVDRATIIESEGFDAVAAAECLSRFLRREANRRRAARGFPWP